MKKLVLTYGLMVMVVLSLSAINKSSVGNGNYDGRELIGNTSSACVVADDDFSFNFTSTKKAITLFSDGFPNYNLYIYTSPTLHLSPELLASSENSKRAVSRYSSSLKI